MIMNSHANLSPAECCSNNLQEGTLNLFSRFSLQSSELQRLDTLRPEQRNDLQRRVWFCCTPQQTSTSGPAVRMTHRSDAHDCSRQRSEDLSSFNPPEQRRGSGSASTRAGGSTGQCLTVVRTSSRCDAWHPVPMMHHAAPRQHTGARLAQTLGQVTHFHHLEVLPEVRDRHPDGQR